MLLSLIEKLPVDLVGTQVLGCLDVRDIVRLERACGSKTSHQLFFSLILYSPPVVLHSSKHNNLLSLEWFRKRRCRLENLTISLPEINPGLHVQNIPMNSIDLTIESDVTLVNYKHLLDNNTINLVRYIDIQEYQNKEVMEQLSLCTRNVESLCIFISRYNNYLTVDILSRWKLKRIHLYGNVLRLTFITLIVQTCTELTIINLDGSMVDDTIVIAVAQHCTKLEKLELPTRCKITYKSLITLSECGLPLKELDTVFIPNIPTADIARRCRHALSCIRHLNTNVLHQKGQDAKIVIPYLTELNTVLLNYYFHSYIPLLTQHCTKLTTIKFYNGNYHVEHILSLCYTNPLLQVLTCLYRAPIANDILIELIHACPHIHTLHLPYETNIIDAGILTLSEHCPQLRELLINQSQEVTEVAVLQLLQCCRKLTRLEVSSSSLSEETWTQLDRNTQKRVSRCLQFSG